MQAPSEVRGDAKVTAVPVRRTSDAPGGRAAEAAFELKGVVAPLTVLRLRSIDVKVIERQLRIKIAEMPQFFLHAPVLLDLGGLSIAAHDLDFPQLAGTLRDCHMVPVAVTNAGDDVRALAAEAGFGFVAPPNARLAGRTTAATSQSHDVTGGGRSTPIPEVKAGAMSTSSPSTRPNAPTAGTSEVAANPRAVQRTHRPPMVIRQPVRSGQIIYAERNDIVVLAPVNAGAEVIADGNVHVYAPMRGRVVAGAQGFTEARIFCQRLEAELVAISGAYMLADDIPPEYRGKSAQVFLEDGHCRVSAL